MKKLIILTTDGKVTDTNATKKPTLKELQAIVGGYIEVVHGTKFEIDGKLYACQLIVDEDGHCKGKAVNTAATITFNNRYQETPQRIVGDVAVLIGWRF